MSKSAPRDLCWQVKLVHDKETGGNYMITARDMKDAKDFLIATGGELPDPDTVTAYAKEYLNSAWNGWKELNWPVWGLFRNWNTYAPKVKKSKDRQCQIHGLTYGGNFCPRCYAPVKEEQ
jgi:hypothetical protein